MTIRMKWVEKPPGRPVGQRRAKNYTPREGSKDLFEHAEQLVRHPMRWAEYPREIKSPRYAQKLCNAVQEGTISAYSPALGFEACYRSVTGKIYVRHNPESVSPTRVAFDEGVAYGRLKALEEVQRLHTAHHQSLMEIQDWPF